MGALSRLRPEDPLRRTRELSLGLEGQKKTELRHLTELAIDGAKQQYADTRAGKITDREAQDRAAARIGALRYGLDDYFWVNDLDGRIVMHPTKPELNGQIITATKDSSFFRDVLDLIKRDGQGVFAPRYAEAGQKRAADHA